MQHLRKIITDGSLTESIQRNSGGVITAVIGDTFFTSLDDVSSPTNPPTASKSGKNSKSKTQKPAVSKSMKTDKSTKKN